MNDVLVFEFQSTEEERKQLISDYGHKLSKKTDKINPSWLEEYFTISGLMFTPALAPGIIRIYPDDEPYYSLQILTQPHSKHVAVRLVMGE